MLFRPLLIVGSRICVGLLLALVAFRADSAELQFRVERRKSLTANVGVGDVHLPETVSDKTPCVLLIHGGGWSAMKRQDVVGIAEFLQRDLGCVVYNIDYRLASKENPWLACGEDCVKAAEFMFSDDFAKACGVRPRQIWVLARSPVLADSQSVSDEIGLTWEIYRDGFAKYRLAYDSDMMSCSDMCRRIAAEHGLSLPILDDNPCNVEGAKTSGWKAETFVSVDAACERFRWAGREPF